MLHSPEEAHLRTRIRGGIYDPLGTCLSAPGIDLEHFFVSWLHAGSVDLIRRCAEATDRGRTLLLTIEPFPRGKTHGYEWRNLLKDIVYGRYDAEIEATCDLVKALPSGVLVRWGHEMEGTRGRYPWAGQAHIAYCDAYRYFVDHCSRIAPHALFVWSPQGEPSSRLYYPGELYLDYIGISIWAHQEWDLIVYGRERALIEIVNEKYRNLADLRKPVIIAEFGVCGLPFYRDSIIKQIDHLSDRFPNITHIIYFNARDSQAWPNGVGFPDWRLAGPWPALS
jgi:beta-mannanase